MAEKAIPPGEAAKPARVSEAAWAMVPPEDRAAVLPLAGTMAMRGFAPDEALSMGLDLLRHRRLLARPRGREALHALSMAYGERHGDAVPRSPQLTAAWAALLAVLEDAATGEDAVKQAVGMGAWETGGACAACGEPVRREERVTGPLAIHGRCLPLMRGIGSAFRAASAALRADGG